MSLVIYAFLGGFALGDWVAVRRRAKVVEYVCKPAVMVVLLAIALRLDPADPDQRAWFLAALAFSLAGDVFLMLPRDLFVAGLASFLVAHLAYTGGFAAEGLSLPRVLGGTQVVLIASGLLGARILRDVPGRLRRPVLAYMAVISVMVVAALGSGDWLAAVGAVLFYVSDATIAWTRFVSPDLEARLFIMVTYHLAQTCLVASLAL